MKSFTGFNIKNLSLKNRIVMPPMCMYSTDSSGMVKDFHKIHYASRAVGGVGLIIVEATAVVPNGRISSQDLGIWSDDHIEGLKSLVNKVKPYGTKIGIQLAHAGRKCGSDDDFIVAPSPIRFSDSHRIPKELTKGDIKELINNFKEAARRANEAGFDTIEIHGAHGYLIHEFLSPLTNKRDDEYGGNIENRTRFLREILDSIKEVWPKEKAVILRISADDYAEGGIDISQMVKIINLIKGDIDIVHVSSGGLIKTNYNVYPGYQVKYSETIKHECNIPTIAVGLIKEYDHIEGIISNNRADLVALGRAILRNPYIVLDMAFDNDIKVEYPSQYKMGYL